MNSKLVIKTEYLNNYKKWFGSISYGLWRRQDFYLLFCKYIGLIKIN